MIAFEDISVICQGAVDARFTTDCLRSLRAAFPGSEVILSTWEGTDVSGLDADKAVFSPDPGAYMADEVAGTPQNVNRQLVSTQAGRPYVLKTRTDISFANAVFLDWFGKYDDVPSPYFKNRLLICSYHTRNPRVMPLCFHPSDWVVFGRTEDVRRYYKEIPLMSPEEAAWFKERKKASVFFTNYINRYVPEQHIFAGFLRQYQQLDFDCYYSKTKKLAEQTEQALADCFVVLDYGKQLAICFEKYDPNRYLERFTLISHWKWEILYKHYALKTSPAVWELYCLEGVLWGVIEKIRIICIRALNRLGWKERIKKMLANRNAVKY